MHIDELTLVLLGAFWTGTSAVFTGMQMADGARDRIVTGKLDEVVISRDYRRHILWYTWVPLRASLTSVSALLGVIIALLPKLTTEADAISKPMFETICILSACVPFAGSLWFAATSVVELQKMLTLTRR